MAFDTRHGGFGDAPKFPRPSELLFLLREHARRAPGGRGAQAPLLMATETLRAMALGGMRDHIGGGFHRYSVDAEWRVPHFEKMLYDQAQLALAYLEAGQATGDRVLPRRRRGHASLRAARHDRSGRRVLLGGRRRQRPAGTGGRAWRAQDGGRVLHLDATPRSRRWSATTSTWSGAASASRNRATRRTIRTGSSPARTCCTWPSRSHDDRDTHAALGRRGRRGAGTRTRRPVRGARAAGPGRISTTRS